MVCGGVLRLGHLGMRWVSLLRSTVWAPHRLGVGYGVVGVGGLRLLGFYSHFFAFSVERGAGDAENFGCVCYATACF